MACFSAILAPEHSITSPRLSLPQICWQRACHIFGRTIYYCRRPQFFCNREADRHIFLQTNDDDIYRPHNPRHLYGKQPEWASADDDNILTEGRNFDCCAMDL